MKQAKEISVICAHCGNTFMRRLSDLAKNQKRGCKNYCSKACASVFFPFKRHLSEASRRSLLKNIPFNLSLADLEAQWNKQNGVCPYSGYQLILRKQNKVSVGDIPEKASLDRIDSSKGYTKDNIEWVCVMAQNAKNTFTPSQLVKFCFDVTKNTMLKKVRFWR